MILDLVKKAGVKFEAWHNIMTIEPPELLKFVYKNFPEVKHNHTPTSMHKLIVKYGYPPLRKFRYCCWELKANHGKDRIKVTGVRAEESPRRAKRQKFEKDFEGEGFSLNLIFDWTTDEIWQYIRENNLPYCELYDKGKTRIGCVFCPFARQAEKLDDAQRYPQFVKYFITACDRAIKTKHENGKATKYQTGADMFWAWLTYDLRRREAKKKNSEKAIVDDKVKGFSH